jgi:hypothetical protein
MDEGNQRGQDSLIWGGECGRLLACQDDHERMKLAGCSMP